MDIDDFTGKAKGGHARALALTSEQKTQIAQRAAMARWGKSFSATHKGNFTDEFGIDVECYVLDDAQKTAVITQRGMGEALGFPKEGSGKQFLRSVKGAKILPHLGDELTMKLDNPLIFQGAGVGANRATNHGYDVAILIDVCKAIIKAESEGGLLKRQESIAKQAHIIVGASAKAGIKGLVYALAGYNPTASEVIAAFKLYVQEEARIYEKEFPPELYFHWQRLYDIPMPPRGKPWQFMHLTVRHIYWPLAKSNGKIYELMKALKASAGDRRKKLFQFLNDLGARALRIHMGRVMEMAEDSETRGAYENRIVARFGGQHELDLVMPSPSSESPPPS